MQIFIHYNVSIASQAQTTTRKNIVAPSLSLASTHQERLILDGACFGEEQHSIHMEIRIEHISDREKSLPKARTATFVTPHIPETPGIPRGKSSSILAESAEKRAAVDARHTHTQFLVHALAVNIDMVCELSAALLCLCKNCIKVCAKNLRIYFLLLRFLCLPIVIIIQRDSKVVVAIAKIFNIILVCFTERDRVL